jgi:hypothetical protein
MMNDKTDPEHVLRLREKYWPYSSSRFQFLVANCHQNHFICFRVTFDIRSETIFENMFFTIHSREPQDAKTRLTGTALAANFLLNSSPSWLHFVFMT